jgi:adenine C2-methylase RlmN of 23S rRNA A2503 and tRNA A37
MVFLIIDQGCTFNRSRRELMKRDIPITEIIAQLQKLPPNAKITIDTKSDVAIVGVVVEREDRVRQIAEIIIPQAKKGC